MILLYGPLHQGSAQSRKGYETRRAASIRATSLIASLLTSHSCTSHLAHLARLALDDHFTQSYVPGVKILRYWGYAAALIAVVGFFLHKLAPAAALILAIAALMYFLVEAPVWCGAETRKGDHCRRNSNGLLRGCSYRQHKWQRTKQTFTPAGGRALLASCRGIAGALALVGGVVAGVQALIAGGAMIVH